ncbi:hypothetical protein V5O48_015677 [Marasmius crinis-equi]|uniref:Uncharacterized protein n=1 Tax=Marasmius crinis-equi TaxID=585013 RepID=A0ABR3ETX1_9AGAR
MARERLKITITMRTLATFDIAVVQRARKSSTALPPVKRWIGRKDTGRTVQSAPETDEMKENSYHDRHSFRSLARAYLVTYAESFTRLVEDYRNKLALSAEQQGNSVNVDQMQIVEYKKNPVIVIEFDKPETTLAPEDCAHISNVYNLESASADASDPLVRRFLSPQQVYDHVLTYWECSSESQIVIVACIPWHPDASYPVVVAAPWLLMDDEKETDDGPSSCGEEESSSETGYLPDAGTLEFEVCPDNVDWVFRATE